MAAPRENASQSRWVSLWAGRWLVVAAALASCTEVKADPPLDRPASENGWMDESSLEAVEVGERFGEETQKVPGPSTPEAEAKKKADEKAAKEKLAKAVAGAYAPLFYDNKFDFLCDPNYCDWHLGESLKRLAVGPCVTLDLGGQYRIRHHSERNFRGLGLTGRDDDFLLHRTRLYGNAQIGDFARAYVEYIDAESNYEDFAPRAIEVNRSDLLNLFGDVLLGSTAGGELWVRGGRQELLYGNQRLISALDWANTRRTFDGAKLYWRGTDWDVDAFWTQPVLVDPRNFDHSDGEQEFYGVYATRKCNPELKVDLFFLQYSNDRVGQGFDLSTYGGRLWNFEGPWMWELEGGVQTGDNPDHSTHEAGFVAAGLGKKLDDLPMKPVVWGYYDWASGGDVRGGRQGFDHLFPLGHRYMGFMDLFARSNIETPNVQCTLKPHEKVSLLVWYYYFFLENKNDTPYSVVMTPFNPGQAPASADLGHEIDFYWTWSMATRAELGVGYSHFFPGAYYRLTPGSPTSADADFYYTQFTLNF
jgi:hypothetical protein